MKDDANPMQRAHAARRCSVKSKRTGLPCKDPAVQGWNVCRMHGARGGHRESKSNPAFRYGVRSKRFNEARAFVSSLQRIDDDV